METIKMGKLIIARHHESEWNKLGKWTGVTEVHLSPEGFEGAKEMGKLISNFHFDNIFTSTQIRAHETLENIMITANISLDTPIEKAKELNERDYGDYTGKNKLEIKDILGEVEFKKLRRGWDVAISNGESLKMVYERAIPYYLNKILPLIKGGKNVLIVAHGNSIRSIIKYIENISDEGISDVEMPFGSFLVYDLDENGHMVDKEIRKKL